MNWGFIGCGNLGQAIVSGAIRKKLIRADQIYVTHRRYSKSLSLKKALKVKAAKNNAELLSRVQVCVVGTKPQDIVPVLEELAQSSLKNKIVISLAAGVESATLLKYCSHAQALFRVMANTPVQVEEGFFGIQRIKGASKDQKAVSRFFGALGTTVLVSGDRKMSAITAGSASGVGFVFSFMEEFQRFFQNKGFTPTQARDAAVATFLGASKLAHSKSGEKLSRLKDAVTSKKGTTFAGLKTFQRRGVPPGLRAGLEAAFKRSESIAKSLRQNTK